MILKLKYKDFLKLLYEIKNINCNYKKVDYLLNILNIKNNYNISNPKMDEYNGYFTIYKNNYKIRYTFLYDCGEILNIYIWSDKKHNIKFNMYNIIDINLFIKFLEYNFYNKNN